MQVLNNLDFTTSAYLYSFLACVFKFITPYLASEYKLNLTLHQLYSSFRACVDKLNTTPYLASENNLTLPPLYSSFRACVYKQVRISLSSPYISWTLLSEREFKSLTLLLPRANVVTQVAKNPRRRETR